MRIQIKRRKRAPNKSSYYLYGFHSVLEAISNPRREKIELWLTKNAYKKLDDLFDNRLSKAMKVDSFKGSIGKTIELYGNGNIAKLSLVGLGKKNAHTTDKLRAVAANIIRSAEANKISSRRSRKHNLQD